jgi:hypothetical protein
MIGGGVPRDVIPREVLLQELQAAASAPWWSVQACLPFEGRGRQLNIFVQTDTKLRDKATFSAVHTAVLAERFAPGFDRYLVSLRSPGGSPGWVAFDGAQLRQLRASGTASIEDYPAAIESGGMFFGPRRTLPSWLRRFDHLATMLPTGLEQVRTSVRQQLGRPSIEIRNVRCHRDPWLVVKADVVVHDATVELVQKSAAWIVRKCIAEARTKFPLKGTFPVGFAQITLFSKVHRDRRHRSYGLGPHLIARITKRRDARKRFLNLHRSRIETLNGLRFEWNSNWPQLGDHLAT